MLMWHHSDRKLYGASYKYGCRVLKSRLQCRFACRAEDSAFRGSRMDKQALQAYCTPFGGPACTDVVVRRPSRGCVYRHSNIQLARGQAAQVIFNLGFVFNDHEIHQTAT